MLLWIPSSPPSLASCHHPQHHSHHHHHHRGDADDNEKGDKLRRRAAEARFRKLLMALGLLALAFFATVSQVQYTQKRHHQPSLRIPGGNPNDRVVVEQDVEEYLSPEQQAKEIARLKREKEQEAAKAKEGKGEQEEEEEEENVMPKEQPDDFFVPHSHLPENSIYRLTMTDVTGSSVDLSQFVGMVSLVVNTACH